MGGDSLRVTGSTVPLTTIADLSNGPEAASVMENGSSTFLRERERVIESVLLYISQQK